jgi:hypothetical protein
MHTGATRAATSTKVAAKRRRGSWGGRAAARAISDRVRPLESVRTDHRATHTIAAVGEYSPVAAVGGGTVPLAVHCLSAGVWNHLRCAAGGGRRPLTGAGRGRGRGAATRNRRLPSFAIAVIATMCITGSSAWSPATLFPCHRIYNGACVIRTSIILKSNGRKSRGG